MKKSDQWRVTGDRESGASRSGPQRAPVKRQLSAFTLIELLVVITILGILAGLGVPALKNIGKSNVNVSASRQLLDDIGRARQLAMSRRTTVYMVFVPTNFWIGLPPSTALTNLADKQLTGYTFVSLRSVGDQPGRSTKHYLAPWQSLPDGTFIAQKKFTFNSPANPPANPFYISRWDQSPPNPPVPIYGFNTNSFPFPTETATNALLPYLAFNSFGQLTFDGQSLADRDEYIPIAQGSVMAAIDPATKTLLLPLPGGPPDIIETPSGNSTNSMYNIIHIDRLTGRAMLEFQKVQ